MDRGNSPGRKFLFLQGMATRFFSRLAAALIKRGHEVRRINFNGGDRLFWLLPGASDYRGDIAEWPRFLERRLNEWGITDIILFGDCRPLHSAAIRLASLRGVLVHVFEEGYLRPDWVTLEIGGVNDNSSLPRDPAWFRRAALELPQWRPGTPVPASFFRRAAEDVVYNAAACLLTWRYPRYRTHRISHPFVEYAFWLRRFARSPLARRRTARDMAKIRASGRPYFVLPLQLDDDSQIRRHSSFGSMMPALTRVIASFAGSAPPDALLVVRQHPLDCGMTNWRGTIRRLAADAGVGGRVTVLERGDLGPLLARSRGVVTVNSTVGFLALSLALPVIALGSAVYDMPELTFQGGLDDFWTGGTPPNGALFDAFRRVLAARTQVNGGFFSRAGLSRAVAGSVARLEAAADRRQLHTVAPATACDDLGELISMPAAASFS